MAEEENKTIKKEIELIKLELKKKKTHGVTKYVIVFGGVTLILLAIILNTLLSFQSSVQSVDRYDTWFNE